jgi:hypothetical protein
MANLSIESEKSLQIWAGRLKEEIPQDNLNVYKAMATSISYGVELEKKLVKPGLLFVNTDRIRSFIGVDFFDPQVGVVSKDEIMTTTRDGWAKSLNAPGITCEYNREGQPEILVVANNAAGTPFNDEVLPGLNLIRLRSDGKITGENILSANGAERNLTEVELCDLARIFLKVALTIQRYL